jgi:aminoglycoside phosphotransferase (APT) family kinase protein
MPELDDYSRFEQLITKIDPHSRLLHTWELTGGVSARVTAVEIERPDGLNRRLVVRQHGATDLQRNPNIAGDEYTLLQILQSAGVPAPVPCYFDQSGDIFPAPFVVVEHIEGHTEFSPVNRDDFLLSIATHLATFHSTDWSRFDLSFLPNHVALYDEKLSARPTHLDHSLEEGRIRDMLEPAWPFPNRNRPVLLHGDYWPGNILWHKGRLAGIIDWEDAHVGDPLADLAISRLEILWAFDMDTMRTFTRHYQSLIKLDFSSLPYWDLCAALRPAFQIATWAGTPAREESMRIKHRLFVAQAFEALSSY